MLHWPFFNIEVRSPRLLLRPIQDKDFDEVVDLIDGGIHDPGIMPFSNDWTDVEPTQRALNACQYWWRQRAQWSQQDWSLPMVVVLGHKIIGVQDISASDFSIRKSVSTGSWLGREYQGQGYGKEMRHAILGFAFCGLQALEANSAAIAQNEASIGVSTSIGYAFNGEDLLVVRGKAEYFKRYRLDRGTWLFGDHPEIKLSGLTSGVLGLFDADAE